MWGGVCGLEVGCGDVGGCRVWVGGGLWGRGWVSGVGAHVGQTKHNHPLFFQLQDIVNLIQKYIG